MIPSAVYVVECVSLVYLLYSVSITAADSRHRPTFGEPRKSVAVVYFVLLVTYYFRHSYHIDVVLDFYYS